MTGVGLHIQGTGGFPLATVSKKSASGRNVGLLLSTSKVGNCTPWPMRTMNSCDVNSGVILSVPEGNIFTVYAASERDPPRVPKYTWLDSRPRPKNTN